MEFVKELINQIQSIGIHFNLDLIGDPKTGGFLNQVREFESGEGIASWIILREMGLPCSRLNNANYQGQYSDDVSTIIFEDYFFHNRISYLFQELNRISKGAFTFEVVDEFEPLYDLGHNNTVQGFWKELDNQKGKVEYNCKYVIMGKPLDFKYEFFNRRRTYLNSEFVDELLSRISDELEVLNIHCLEPEEFITFIVCKEEVKNKLKADLGVNFIEKEVSIHQAKEPIKLIQELESQQPEPDVRKIEKKKWWEFWK